MPPRSLTSLMMMTALLCAPVALPAVAHAQETQATEGQLELDLARIQLFLETGRKGEALALIEKLKEAHPGDLRVKTAEAETYLALGQRGRSLELLQEASQLSPSNEDIMARRQMILHEDRQFASYGMRRKETGNSSDETIHEIHGSFVLSDHLTAGISAERNDYDITSITSPLGVTQRRDDDASRATASLLFDRGNGDKARTSLYVADSGIGGGGLYRLADRYGHTELYADYHKPDWDFLESLAFEGTRDTVGLQRHQYLGGRVTADAGAALNRYNLENADNAASSHEYNLLVSWLLPREKLYIMQEGFYARLNYSLDAEYVLDVESQMAAGGLLFSPLAMSSREIHTLYLSGGSTLFSPDFRVEAFGGYGFDRLGGQGVMGGLSAAYTLNNRVNLDTHYFHSGISERGDDNVDVYGVNITLLF